MCSKEEIGKEIKRRLEKGYNIIDIADWAYTYYSDNIRKLTSEMQEVLEYLALMEEGPEFEFSEDELNLIAERMLKEDNHPLRGIMDPEN